MGEHGGCAGMAEERERYRDEEDEDDGAGEGITEIKQPTSKILQK